MCNCTWAWSGMTDQRRRVFSCGVDSKEGEGRAFVVTHGHGVRRLIKREACVEAWRRLKGGREGCV